MAKDAAYRAAEKKIQQALQSHATKLDLRSMKLTELPESIGQLNQLQELDLGRDYLKNESENNRLTTLPDSLGQLTQLTSLDLSNNQLTTLPDSLGQLTQLTELVLSHNQLTALPDSLGQLTQLINLHLNNNNLTTLPESSGQLTGLRKLYLYQNKLTSLPQAISSFRGLTVLMLGDNQLSHIPEWIAQIKGLEVLDFDDCQLVSLPEWVNQFIDLEILHLSKNKLTTLPSFLSRFEKLTALNLNGNPLNPALQSAYDACSHGKYEPLWAYLRSLEQNAEPLYEAKLVLVGEGNVGKTTLLKALKGKKGEEAPKEGESKTHGVEIDIQALHLPHPEKDGVKIQLNAWDFGGQEVYRVTHQFFFSRRSLYLVVWQPRRNIQQAQVEDWLNMIRLRVGDEARVIIISTHCKTGETLARIDKPVLQQQYGDMIVGFHEVDSLVPDQATGEMVGIAELKKVIAAEAIKLNHVGMLFNNDWKAARNELIARPEPKISYSTFAEVCSAHKLSQIDSKTLAGIMNDLGYIVHYGDDEKLRDEVVLKPEWLTKAIGFVLEDRATQENDGILPDERLLAVWHDHKFKAEPRYNPELYPFFLRLMEKYDVSYRLPDDRNASLVAQHVPQVRPALPWLPEQETPKNLRRIAMICAMEEDPPGLVPWMIVRTHDYAVEQNRHRLHWQKGVFLNHGTHGTAMLEKRGREFHVYAQAEWPEYLMNVLQYTLQKLIDDNWPGLEGRYRFMVPCPEMVAGQPCKGRFNIHALRQYLAEGDATTRCPECTKKQSIVELLFGFEERDVSVQLREIKEQLAGLNSRIADYFMAMMRAIADEAKHGPRLFTFAGVEAKWSIKEIFSRPMKLQLWCEAEGCQHPVMEKGKGVYEIKQTREWVTKIAPCANLILSVLKTVAPMAGSAINVFFGEKTTETWKIADQLDLAKEIIDKFPEEIKISDRRSLQRGMLNKLERSGILALHRFLNEVDPTQSKLGLHRVATYTGDFRWLCEQHYQAWQPKIPDVIQPH